MQHTILAAVIVSLGVASCSSASAKQAEHRREGAMHCNKIQTASRHEEEYPRLIQLSAPTFYSPSPSKVASAILSVTAEENPTSADWPPQDSG